MEQLGGTGAEIREEPPILMLEGIHAKLSVRRRFKGPRLGPTWRKQRAGC